MEEMPSDVGGGNTYEIKVSRVALERSEISNIPFTFTLSLLFSERIYVWC